MALPTDPVFAEQWHLRNAAANQYDLNVVQAWNAGFTGQGVRVFVADDGFDLSHPDISPNNNPNGQFDYVAGDSNPSPGFNDNHGTACMGLIGAARNGIGAVGVAYGADLTGHRGFSNSTSFDQYIFDLGAGMLRAANFGGDVLSMSSGYGGADSYFDNGLSAVALASCRADIGTAVETGRGGLGLIMVKAAGNERADFYNTNTLSIDADPRLISVASVDRFGDVDEYSNYGGNVLVVAFGSPGEIVTTDRQGTAGYANGNFTRDFNGTSAATPQVAGVVALMLEANPGLGWRDVQDILAASARVVGSGVAGDGATPIGFELDTWIANRSEQWNGGGQMFSNDYGFGLVDAGAAVRLAQAWFATGGQAATSATQDVVTRDLLSTPTDIPDGNGNFVTLSSTIAAAGQNFEIDYSTVTIAMTHAFVGDLTILLTNDDNDSAVLLDVEGGGTDFPGTWTFTTRQFHGENAAGTWFVQVMDSAAGDAGTLSDIVIRHYGDSATVNDRHIVTDQYATFVAEAGRRSISDSNGGIDTLNAAPLSTGARIILDSTVNSRIDGVNTRVSATIENIIGGLGADQFTGSAGRNSLIGRDGDDILMGRGGDDDLRGSNGSDRLNGGDGADRLTGGAGPDSFIFNSGLGAANADRVTDFNRNSDIFRLDNADFIGLVAGQLQAFRFVANAQGQATQAGHRIIQDTNSGQLYFDRDGDGGAARQLFAVLENENLRLDRTDFVIF